MKHDSGNLAEGGSYSPRRDDAAPAPAASVAADSDRQPLDRVQRVLIWFASVLIAVTVFDRIRAFLGG
ncbi:MAG TPA: hypothetical protein VG269_01135 [Tepidisphaeraceae bacterium]|jgi:hypothetical protein|nr:hypothetical protein [Tepidisphaeraceae bacterium]